MDVAPLNSIILNTCKKNFSGLFRIWSTTPASLNSHARHLCPYKHILLLAILAAAAQSLLTLHDCRFAIIVPHSIVFLLKTLHAVKRQSDGSIKSTLNAHIAFSGFKLHLVINDRGELLATQLTSGNIDDRRPVLELTKHLQGKLYGDKGYISQPLAETLETQDVCLLTKVRKNMKPRTLSELDTALLKKRMLVETVIGQLKSQTQGQHTHHRSWINYPHRRQFSA